MSIVGIDEITYGVDDLPTCRRFFLDWGLDLVQRDKDRFVFETENGCRVIVAAQNDPGLPPAFESGSTVREVVWGVENETDLTRIRGLLVESDGFIDADGRVGCTDPVGLAVRFQVTCKHEVDVAGCPTNTFDRHPRVDQRGAIYERARPIEIGHVVLFVTDVERSEAFYSRLGFVASDRYSKGRGSFMRCAPRGGHHDLFLLRVPEGKTGLNHVAFAVRDIHEVFGGGLHISRCGWKTQLGPGRHPISSAYFWYFKSPAGGLCEYYSDEDELTEHWQPAEIDPAPTMFAEWAIDGGIDGNTRRQQNIEAGGTFLSERRDQ